MNALLVYMLKSAIYMAAFYFVYAMLLSRDTYYGRNRGFILFSIAASLLLPFITLNSGRLPDTGFFGKWLSEVLITAGPAGTPGQDSASWFTVPHVVNAIYVTGVAFFLSRFLFDLINLLFLIYRQRDAGSSIIRFHAFNTSGFSAMGYIFLNSGLNPDEEAEIIRHEKNHLRQNHFLDIILAEMVKAFQWFNPAVYMFNRSLRAVHEYQADNGCLKSGTTVTAYQNLLLRQVLKSGSLNLSNSFSNPSLVRKRMIMMTKRRTPFLANIKLFFIVPVAGLALLLVSSSGRMSEATLVNNTSETPDHGADASNIQPYTLVDVMPAFPGGDEALLQYIAKNAVYPENAKNNGIQGRVVVRFCVTETGNINRISVLKSVDPDLDAEAVRVTGTLPRFTPGKLEGKSVPVWFMVPITFTLR